MFKIGDFSKLGQVSVRMLRHYDKMGLLEPEEIDRFTGYRYYTIEQLPRLNRILALKDLGLSLEQIKDLLDEGLPPERLRGMLMLKQRELAQEIDASQSRLARVEARLQRIEHEDDPSPYEVVVKAVTPLTIASVRQVVPSVQEMDFYCASMFNHLYTGLKAQGIPWAEPELTLYHMEEYAETDLDVETAVPVDKQHLLRASDQRELTVRVLPAVSTMAALIYEGPYHGLPAAVLALLAWVGTNHCTVVGPMRELHLSGPAHQNGQLVEPAILEIQVPIQRLETA